MPLTDQQRETLRHLDWLFGDAQRGQGRSTVMAVAFIRAAARRPGRWVYVFDHYGTVDTRRLLLRRIEELAREHPQTNRFLQMRRDGLRFDPSMIAIDDWLPAESSEEAPTSFSERTRSEMLDHVARHLAEAQRFNVSFRPDPPPPPPRPELIIDEVFRSDRLVLKSEPLPKEMDCDPLIRQLMDD